MEMTQQPSKKNRLTLYILIAMALGILVGYILHENAAGSRISYAPAKDFIGKDSMAFGSTKDPVWQNIFVVKDSAAYKKAIDSVSKTSLLVVSNTDKSYEVIGIPAGVKTNKITQPPKHGAASITALKKFSDLIKLFATIFLRLVQMIIAPLVFSTLVVGIARLGDLKTVGRVGGKAMLWFVSASLVSLFLGLLLVNITKPGVGVNLTKNDPE